MAEFIETHLIYFAPVCLAGLGVAILAVLTKPAHIHRTAKGHAKREVQTVHQYPTPRVGGVALAVGLLVAAYLLRDLHGDLLSFALLAAMPVFFAGLLEDTAFNASPRERLFAAMAGSLAMVFFTGQTIHTGVAPGIDILLETFVVSIVFTVFATTAVCHSFNLVDGMNGLAGSVALVASVALAIMAINVGDLQVATMAGGVAAAVLGILFLNFPFAKLFLGDAGAYLLGFLVAWTGVLLIARNPELSGWAVLLTVFWPFLDTTAAVLRRVLKKEAISKADKLHFHHIVMRRLEAHMERQRGAGIANPLTTVILLPFIILPAWFGVLTAHDNRLAVLSLLLCICGYFAIKSAVVRHFGEVSRKPIVRLAFEDGEEGFEAL